MGHFLCKEEVTAGLEKKNLPFVSLSFVLMIT